jgi:N-acetylmuramoyl-L-alanine amidase
LLSESDRQSLLEDLNAPKVAVDKGGARCTSTRPIKKVFIDPGHGGSDLGTKFGSLNEKDITLKFGVLVAEELRRRGFLVSFSRTKDVFLPLDVRSTLAKKWDADLFVSIHMNSAPSKDANGTETYILSVDATDAAARKLALIENSIVQTASAKQSAVQDILWDMEQTTYLQDSAFLASYIQKQVTQAAHDFLHAKKIEWKDRGVRQAPFFVLSHAPMPAVLVELGYLSNAQDRKMLTDKNFQENLAKAIANGVKQYQEACKAH